MSYFDDNEDFIIYGKKQRQPRTPITPNGWTTASGDFILVTQAETGHLQNALAKFKRENRAPVLCQVIEKELSERTKPRNL